MTVKLSPRAREAQQAALDALASAGETNPSRPADVATDAVAALVDAGAGPGMLRFKNAVGWVLCEITLQRSPVPGAALGAFLPSLGGVARARSLPKIGTCVPAGVRAVGADATTFELTDSSGNVVVSGNVPDDINFGRIEVDGVTYTNTRLTDDVVVVLSKLSFTSTPDATTVRAEAALFQAPRPRARGDARTRSPRRPTRRVVG